MREALAKYHNTYIEVEAEFTRFATSNDRRNLLFRNVTHEGEVITDHIWVPMNVVRNAKKVNEIKLKKHVIYKMRGKVYLYKKYDKTKKKMVYDFCLKSVKIEMEG